MKNFIRSLLFLLTIGLSSLPVIVTTTAIVITIVVIQTEPVKAAARFGVCTAACTWDSSSTAMWSASSGGATGASVPGASDTVTFDANTCVGGVTCTITLNFGGTITIQSLTMGACTASTTGCIFDNSVNNNNITVTNTGNAFNGSGTGTRNYKLGSATYTLTGNGATWTIANASNLTFAGSSSTITFSPTGSGSNEFRSSSTSGSALTYGTINFGSPGYSFNFRYLVFGGGTTTTFTNFNVTAPNYVYLSASSALAVTNAVNWAGSSTAQFGFATDSPGNSAAITVGGGSTGSWGAFRDIGFTGSPTFTNSFNLGNVSGATITASSGSGSCIFGGWLLWGDIRGDNDNWPAFLDKAG